MEESMEESMEYSLPWLAAGEGQTPSQYLPFSPSQRANFIHNIVLFAELVSIILEALLFYPGKPLLDVVFESRLFIYYSIFRICNRRRLDGDAGRVSGSGSPTHCAA